ncbi:hypothetical protein RCG19_20925 [Neobacillus sp. OS1-2]|uniref:YfjL-like protein n=1 Tax=Neobacillus sp. OS1-2 TaxID=3070680 RepID=UPI0027E05BB0|nr:hypothetical protein [Neobacillus sp. OS1-2]WML39609.1 hypothetical protein RCG19_20925 [Neobacillus sp. OS1-2]
MKKKILYSLLAVSLIGLVLVIYIQAGGNPINKNKAKENLTAYLKETYPDMDYEIKRSVKYVSIDDSYRFRVLTKDPLGVETIYLFDVYNYKPFKVFNDTIHKSRIDKDSSKKLNAQAEQYIKTLLQKKVPEVNQVDTDVEVYNNDATKWTPQLKTPKPILIMLEIDKGNVTKEQMLQQCKTMQELLNNESIDYYMTEAGYRSIVNGEENYEYVSFTPKQKLTISDIN